MRKITAVAVENFYNLTPYRNGNTSVSVVTKNGVTTSQLILHGSVIAKYNPSSKYDRLYINDCGFRTATTKERINGVLSRCDASVFQKSGWWYIKENYPTHSITHRIPQNEWIRIEG